MVLLVGALGAGALGACDRGSSASYAFRGTEAAAGADANLRVSEQEQNYEVDLRVENLLPPERAMAGAQAYAVWIQPRGQETPTHLGNLSYDDGNRRGELRTITPHAAFDVFVTAEPSTAPMEPRGPTVLSESVHE